MSAVPAGIWSRRTFLKSGGAMIIGATLPAAAWAQGSGAAAMPGTVGSAIDKALGKTLDAAELAAYTTTASVILNLDEVITRQ